MSTDLLVAVRRARGDVGLLLLLVVVIAVGAALAAGVPTAVQHSLDAGARDAVRLAQGSSDVVVDVPVQSVPEGPGGTRRFVRLPDLLAATRRADRLLPPALARVAAKPVSSVLSPPLELRGPGGPAVQVGWVQPGAGTTVRYVTGRAPSAARTGSTASGSPPTLEVGLTPELAGTLGARVGERISTRLEGQPGPALLVTGLYEPQRPGDAAWRALPGAGADATYPDPSREVGPFSPQGSAGVALTAGSELKALQVAFSDTGLAGEVRVPVPGAGVTAAAAPRVVSEVRDLLADPTALVSAARFSPTVRSGLADVLLGYEQRQGAAVAQMSVLLVGLLGVVGTVVLLGAGLLIGRRRDVLALERARGASAGSVAARLLLESAAVVLVGAGAGTLLAVLVTGGPPVVLWPLLCLAALALLAAPLLGAATAAGSWARRQVPADRRARARLRSLRRGRRVVIEGLVLAVAAGAVLAARGRGGLQDAGGGADPLLAAAPLLLAGVAVVVLLRLYPLPLRALAAAARRARGAVGVVATTRAARSASVLPLLALTLATSLGVAAGLVQATLDAGQERASWERVGADVRAEGVPDAAAAAAALGARPGVTATAVGALLPDVTARIGADDATVDVLLVSRGYAKVTAGSPLGYRGELSQLRTGATAGSSASVPVVVDRRLARRIGAQQVQFVVGSTTTVSARVRGTLSVPPTGWLSAPAVVADLATVQRLVDEPVRPDVVWADGPGAAAAAEALPQLRRATVTTRAGWLDDLRGSGLLAGFASLLRTTLLTVGALAAVGVLLTVAAGARDRGRTLSALRTLGLTVRQGRRIALAELVPLVIAGVVAGAVSGTAVLLLLAPALGLGSLTGGLAAPALVVPAALVVGVVVAAGVLLVVAVAVETAAHRRAHLGEVLRVGGR